MPILSYYINILSMRLFLHIVLLYACFIIFYFDIFNDYFYYLQLYLFYSKCVLYKTAVIFLHRQWQPGLRFWVVIFFPRSNNLFLA